MKVLLALHRVGPHHDARFQAALGALDLEVLETRPESQEYPWCFQPTGGYRRHALRDAAGPEQDPPWPSLDRQLSALLDQRRPDVVVTVGWADRAYRRLLRHARRRRLRVGSKRMLVRHYSAALVAGREGRLARGSGVSPRRK
jgi:hypothetical protein